MNHSYASLTRREALYGLGAGLGTVALNSMLKAVEACFDSLQHGVESDGPKAGPKAIERFAAS